MTDVHARIQAFLQQRSVLPLSGSAPAPAPDGCNKAGALPYVMAETRRYLVMKPVAKHPHLPPPAYQLCKGTRMELLASGWHDIADGQTPTGTPETMAATALREGIEELGLALEGIVSLHDAGTFAFASTKSQTPRLMWLFPAKLQSELSLLPMAEVAKSTAERRWMTAEEFATYGRGDHVVILQNIESRLAKL